MFIYIYIFYIYYNVYNMKHNSSLSKYLITTWINIDLSKWM